MGYCQSSCTKDCTRDDDCDMSHGEMCCPLGSAGSTCLDAQACPKMCTDDSNCSTANGDVCGRLSLSGSEKSCMEPAESLRTCSGDGDCLAPYSVDRRIHEKTVAPYVQVKTKFDAFSWPAHLVGGLRYEKTTVDSSALVQDLTLSSLLVVAAVGLALLLFFRWWPCVLALLPQPDAA